MKTKAAFIFVAPEADPQKHCAVIESPVIELSVVGVKNYQEAEEAAQKLVADGVTAIELCAGFGSERGLSGGEEFQQQSQQSHLRGTR